MLRAVPVTLLALSLLLIASCTQERPGSAPSGPVRFFREHVTVTVSGSKTEVCGIYSFRNESDEAHRMAMEYPFPIDRHHRFPLRIRVLALKDGELVPMGYSRKARGIGWDTAFGPREEKQIRVEYTQEIDKNHAIYIVATTREWGRPIEVADFEFRLPKSFEDVSFSFEPDRKETRGDTAIYYLSEKDFLPEADLVVTWQ